MSCPPVGVGGLFDNIVGAVTSVASGGDPVSAVASLVPAVSLSVSPQPTPGPLQTWQRWQQIHPGSPQSDYQNWWNQYGQGGGTINGAGVGQDALEDVLNANAGRDYTVIRGDSPASIARKFGVSLDQLLNANPQKATTVVRGVRTWTSLSINEGLSLPKAGVRLGYVAQAAGQTTMPSIADLLAQGYVATTNNCFAGEYCYIKEVPLVAGNQSRTYTFVSNDPTSRAMGTSVSVPTGQGQVPSIWPAASGVAPVPVDTPSAVQQAAPLAVTPVARVAHHGLSTGAMIGIGVGVAAVVGVVIYASSGKRR